MSEQTEVKEDGVQPTQSGAEGAENKVAYETFSRALDEKKKLQSKYEGLEAKVADLEREKLEKEGSLEQALEAYKSRVMELEQKEKALVQTFAQKEVDQRIVTELSKRGCKDANKALRIMDDKDYQALVGSVDDSFSLDAQTSTMILDKFQKENDFIFGRPAPKIADGVPKNDVEKPVDAKTSAVDRIKKAKTPEEYQAALEAAMKHFN